MSKTAQPDGYIPRDRSHHRKESDLAPLDPNFGGCGRVIPGDDGGSEFRTVQPGPYPWPNGMNDWRPAHIHLQGSQETIIFDS